MRARTTEAESARETPVAGDRRVRSKPDRRVVVGLSVAEDAVAERIAAAVSQAGFGPVVRATTVEQLTTERGLRRPAVIVLAGEATSSERTEDIRLVHERLGEVDIVVVASVPGGRGVRKALSAGASGFVLASELASALPAAIHAVRAGLVAVPRHLVQHVHRPALSAREKQILGMVVLGFQNQEIAAKLHLADTTVKSHLSSAFKKLDVGSRTEAAALVLDHREGLGPGILRMPGAEGPVA